LVFWNIFWSLTGNLCENFGWKLKFAINCTRKSFWIVAVLPFCQSTFSCQRLLSRQALFWRKNIKGFLSKEGYQTLRTYLMFLMLFYLMCAFFIKFLVFLLIILLFGLLLNGFIQFFHENIVCFQLIYKLKVFWYLNSFMKKSYRKTSPESIYCFSLNNLLLRMKICNWRKFWDVVFEHVQVWFVWHCSLWFKTYLKTHIVVSEYWKIESKISNRFLRNRFFLKKCRFVGCCDLEPGILIDGYIVPVKHLLLLDL